ncbi:hypothetical protein GGI42DRAFT_36648 [Trichoderma sp. SZMC 28013]
MKTGFLNDPARLLQDQIHKLFCHVLALASHARRKHSLRTQCNCNSAMPMPCLTMPSNSSWGKTQFTGDAGSPIGSLVGVTPSPKDSPVCHSSSVLLQHKWRVWNGGMCVCVLVLCFSMAVCVRYRCDDSIRQALTFYMSQDSSSRPPLSLACLFSARRCSAHFSSNGVIIHTYYSHGFFWVSPDHAFGTY